MKKEERSKRKKLASRRFWEESKKLSFRQRQLLLIELFFADRANIPFPFGGRETFPIGEDLDEIALREEAGGLANFSYRHLGVGGEELLGVVYAQVGYPFAERHGVGPLDVGGEIGAVGAEADGQIFYRKTRMGKAVLREPCRKVLLYRRIVGGSVADGFLLFLRYLQDSLHLFVEEQVVHVGAIEVYIKRYRRQDPEEHILVGQEGEQSATYAIDDRPPGEYRHPADVGGDVLGVGVVEEANCLMISIDDATGEIDAVAEEPQCHGGEAHVATHTLGQDEEDDAGEQGEHCPVGHVSQEPSPSDVEAVEQRDERGTEEPVGEEIGGEVHQDGGILALEAQTAEEMHRIVGGEHEQCHTHDTARTLVVGKNGLVGSLRHKEVDDEEEHQRQCKAQRVLIYRIIHCMLVYVGLMDAKITFLFVLAKDSGDFLY